MHWIDHGPHSRKRQALLTDTDLFVFLPGEYGLDEIREMVDAGADPDTLIADSGEKYPRDSIEFISHDPGKESLKIHCWSAGKDADRYVNKVAPDEAKTWLSALVSEWDDYTLIKKEHRKFGRLVIPGTALFVILFFAAGLWWSLDQGNLEDPVARGPRQVRLFLITMAKVFHTTGKPGVAVAAILGAAYPIIKIFKVLRRPNPTVTIAHRNDISIGASEAVDRFHPEDIG